MVNAVEKRFRTNVPNIDNNRWSMADHIDATSNAKEAPVLASCSFVAYNIIIWCNIGEGDRVYCKKRDESEI